MNLCSKPIKDIVERTGVSLTKAGDVYKGLCPLHNDKNTPSLTVYPKTNSWYCFGCGGGTDSIDFIKQRYNFNYPQAVKWIEDNFEFNIKEEIKLPEIKICRPKVVPHEFITYWHQNLGEMRQYFYGRGFEDKIIDNEMWGWDGHRVCIPVWEGEPQYSKCLGVRKRTVDSQSSEEKYIGLRGANQPTIWGRWYCRKKDIGIAFAGELDAARAVQDGFGGFSVVNGVNSISKFPKDWPDIWFPNTKRLIVIFDKKEEVNAGQLAQMWNNYKGFMTAKLFHWLDNKDYCNFINSLNCLIKSCAIFSSIPDNKSIPVWSISGI